MTTKTRLKTPDDENRPPLPYRKAKDGRGTATPTNQEGKQAAKQAGAKEAESRDRKGRWTKGVSGNPKGREPRARPRALQ